jgi:hypothetical protein
MRAVAFVDSGSAAQAGRCDSRSIDLPACSGNLTDRYREHNRGALIMHCGAEDLGLPLIWSFSRDMQDAIRICKMRSGAGASRGRSWTRTRSNSHEANMTTFDKREEGFEKKFALDEELKFKAMARRNKLLGIWAAEKLGLTGAEAEAYAKEVVLSDFEEAGDHDVFRKIRKDFDAKGVAQSDHQIRRTMDEFLEQAVAQIKAGG